MLLQWAAGQLTVSWLWHLQITTTMVTWGHEPIPLSWSRWRWDLGVAVAQHPQPPLVPPFESDPRLKGQPPKPNAAAAWGCRAWEGPSNSSTSQVPRHDGITGKEPLESWCVSDLFIFRWENNHQFAPIIQSTIRTSGTLWALSDYPHRDPSWAFPPHHSKGVDSCWFESLLEKERRDNH